MAGCWVIIMVMKWGRTRVSFHLLLLRGFWGFSYHTQNRLPKLDHIHSLISSPSSSLMLNKACVCDGFPPSLLIIQIISLTSFWIRVNTNTCHDNTQVSSRMNLKQSKCNFWLENLPDEWLFILLFVSDGVELEFVDLWTPYNTYCFVYNSREKNNRYTKDGKYIYTHYLFHHRTT